MWLCVCVWGGAWAGKHVLRGCAKAVQQGGQGGTPGRGACKGGGGGKHELCHHLLPQGMPPGHPAIAACAVLRCHRTVWQAGRCGGCVCHPHLYLQYAGLDLGPGHVLLALAGQRRGKVGVQPQLATAATAAASTAAAAAAATAALALATASAAAAGIAAAPAATAAAWLREQYGPKGGGGRRAGGRGKVVVGHTRRGRPGGWVGGSREGITGRPEVLGGEQARAALPLPGPVWTCRLAWARGSVAEGPGKGPASPRPPPVAHAPACQHPQ